MKKVKLSKSLVATAVVCTLFGGTIAFAAGAALYSSSNDNAESIWQGVNALGRALTGAKAEKATAESGKATAESAKAAAEAAQSSAEAALSTANSTIASLQAAQSSAAAATAAAQTTASSQAADAATKGAAVAKAKDDQLKALKDRVDEIITDNSVTIDSDKDASKKGNYQNGGGSYDHAAMYNANEKEERAVDAGNR